MIKDWYPNAGLIDRVQNSTTSLTDAENLVLDFVKDWTNKGKCPMAGNSVEAIRSFLQNYMPELVEHFRKSRPLDLAWLKNSGKGNYSGEGFPEEPLKNGVHAKLDGIHRMIEELKFYKKDWFFVEVLVAIYLGCQSQFRNSGQFLEIVPTLPRLSEISEKNVST